MHIAFVDYKLNLRNGGGSNRTVHYLASALTAAGHEVSVITLAPRLNAVPADLPYRVIEAPVARAAHFPGRLAITAVFRKAESRADIFQIEAPSLILPAALYRRLGGRVPVVAQLHIYGHFCSNINRIDAECWRHCSLLDQIRHRDERPTRKIALAPVRAAEHGAKRLLANQVDRFVAVSSAMAQIHARNGLDPRKIVTISPPADLDALLRRGERPGPAPTPAEPFRLLYVGRLFPAKGVDVLLEAVARLPFPFALDIIGDGDGRAALERRVHDLDLASRVRFHGWVAHDDIVERYLGAHLFVHPGRWPDPAPRTIIEAMALGVPLVVTDTGGAPAMAAGAALTARPGDPDDLRAKIARLHDAPDLAAELAATGRRRARQFDTQEALRQFLELYRELCPRARVTPAGAAA